jgi:hypothetical protein
MYGNKMVVDTVVDMVVDIFGGERTRISGRCRRTGCSRKGRQRDALDPKMKV